MGGNQEKAWLVAVGTVREEVMSAIELDHVQPGGVWHWAQEGKERWLRADHTGS